MKPMIGTRVWSLFAAILIATAALTGFTQDQGNTIDKTDLFQMAAEWQNVTGPFKTDFNTDGVVNQLDLLELINAYGGVIAGPTTTPTLPAPTETPLPEDTPTPLPVNTPTPIPGGDTPTPLPPTATPVPPTETPFPTATPGPTQTPVPTPSGVFEEFFTDFDDLNAVTDTSLITYSEDTITAAKRQELIAQNRLRSGNDLVGWYIFDHSQAQFPEDGIALSEPKSAAFNQDFYFYQNNQTSIMEIDKLFNTAGAVTPRVAFDVAWDFDPVTTTVHDFLIVEVQRFGSDTWEMLDINNDNVVIEDDNSVSGGPLAQGTFDGLFDTQLDFANGKFALEASDYKHVEINLPKDQGLRISIRFESDTSVSASGAFLDNLKVYDAIPSGGDPVIASVSPLDAPVFYTDSQNRALIAGQDLTPVSQVKLTLPSGTVNLTPVVQQNGLRVTLPKAASFTQDVTATLQVTRSDGAQSNAVSFTLAKAPKPVITSVDPAPFPLSGNDTILTINGENFRPLFTGADEADASTVTIRQGNRTLAYTQSFDFDSRGQTQLVLDAFEIQDNFDPGTFNITVKNPVSGLVSDPFTVSLANTVTVDAFNIEVGGISGFTYDPASESYPLQTDQVFSLIWQGQGFSPAALNVTIQDVTYVQDGTPRSVNGNTPVVSIDNFSAVLSLAPLTVSATGDLSVKIWNTGGTPIVNTFALNDPQPPTLINADGDWNEQTLSVSNDVQFTVVGDNFRGLGIFGGDMETVTRVYLIPTTGGDEIALPVITDAADISISPKFGGIDQDELTQSVSANYFGVSATQTFRLKVVNPDSGLSAVSPVDEVITFTP